MEIGEFPSVRRKRQLVSTESSSAERANTGCTRRRGGCRRVAEGGRMFKGGRTLPGNPSLLAASPLDRRGSSDDATLPIPAGDAASTFYQRRARFLYPVSTSVSTPFSVTLFLQTVQHSTQLPPLFRPDAQPLSLFVFASLPSLTLWDQPLLFPAFHPESPTDNGRLRTCIRCYAAV